MKNKIYAVILAGGSGSRLWPLSRNLLPKQFIKFGKASSLFEKTIRRISRIAGENILVATNKEHAAGAGYSQFKNLQILMEPAAKNTAPAIGLAAVYARKLSKSDPVMVVLPSDHAIKKSGAFARVVKLAAREAEKGKIVTLGIRPDWPETGYGYAEIEKKPAKFNSRIMKVRRFTEKPDLETAKKFVAGGRHLWNSGIFVFRASVMLGEFEKYLPKARGILERISAECFDSAVGIDYGKMKKYFSRMPEISIDCAVMEKSGKVYNIPSDIGWSDAGSWHYLYKFLPKDKNKNARFGDVIDIGTRNSLLYSDSRLISAVGLKNLAVIETADAVLVADIRRSQEVKNIVRKLKSARRREFNEHLTLIRPWGSFRVLLDLPDYRVKKITVNPGGKIEFRYHKSSLRHWFAAKGRGEMILGRKKINLKANSHADIPKGVKYMVRNIGKSAVEIIEIQTGKYSAAGDVVNLAKGFARY